MRRLAAGLIGFGALLLAACTASASIHGTRIQNRIAIARPVHRAANTSQGSRVKG